MNGIKQLIPVGSITGDPIGTRRFMEIDPENQSTSVARSVLLYPDGSEYKNPYVREL